ncbi:MAG: hypothetical protein CVU06_00710 [Bacteroidetes bacterium HGW-Bacteroidetes-22]|nr:MAG: hypothetical protein CVU06_00710 [Bacteroidetes bacterium HGW-Bacteroidetes-22]
MFLEDYPMKSDDRIVCQVTHLIVCARKRNLTPAICAIQLKAVYLESKSGDRKRLFLSPDEM